jgi:hypothetical protein
VIGPGDGRFSKNGVSPNQMGGGVSRQGERFIERAGLRVHYESVIESQAEVNDLVRP